VSDTVPRSRQPSTGAPLRRISRISEPAEALGNAIGFARIEVSDTDGRIVVGELTVDPGIGSVARPAEFDLRLGNVWNLSTRFR
jgi:hypothetical protein